MAQLLLASSSLTAAAPASLAEALARVEARLDGWASNSTAYNSLLGSVFAGAGTEPALWQQAAAALQSTLQSSGLAIGLELLDGTTAGGLNGAYTAQAPGGGERIYLNSAWLQTASTEQIEAVLLEEVGHAIDRRLNGASDSPGDEGERFSALLRGLVPTAASFTENDQRQLVVGGQAVSIEASADTTRPRGALLLSTAPAFAAPSANPFGIARVGSFASPAFADIDDDGDLDLFIGEGNTGNILLFLNTASPGATAPAYAGASINPFGISQLVGFAPQPAFADLDHDGDLDLLIGDGGGNTFFFLNTGNATAPGFTASTIPAGIIGVGAAASPTFADIDNDGDLDLFIGSGDGNTLFFESTGTQVVGATTTPIFAAPSSNPFGIPSFGFFASPAFVDIDGDGDLDLFRGIAFSNSPPLVGNTQFLRNTGNATAPAFADEGLNPFGIIPVTTNSTPRFADIDGDGDLDLFIGDASGNTQVFLNTAPAPLAPVTSTTLNGTYGIGAAITLTVQFSEAVNVIGTPRLQLETGGIDRFATFTSVAGNTLTFTYTVQAGDSAAVLDVLSAAALTLPAGSSIRDAAGNNAILTLAAPGAAGSLGANKALVVDGIAPVARTTAPAFAGSASAFGLTAVGASARPSFVDIDGDGDLDAFIGNNDGNTFFFRNTGSATAPAFAASVSPFGLPNVGTFARPAFADSDGDGDLDAFIGNRDGNTLFFRNTGSATAPAFTGSASAFGLPNIGVSAKPAFADIDGDGDLDAFIGTNDGNTLFFRNTAAPGATAPAFASSASAIGLPNVGVSANPAFADIDGDGDLDAFIGERFSTFFFRNTGSATAPAFAGSASAFGLADVGTFASPAFTDIDADGDLDAFIGNDAGSTLFFRNNAPVLGVSSSTANGRYGTAGVITLTVRFSEAVVVNTVGGSPTLLLETGAVDRVATFSSAAGNTLTFSYTVQTGDTSPDLDLHSINALQLNGATIRDAAGNNAVLTLAAPGSPASLAGRKNLVIDGIDPLITAGPTAATAPGVSGFTLRANEAATAALRKADNSLLFPTALAANTSTLVTVAAQSAITATSLVVTDLAGNPTTSATRVLLGTNGNDTLTGSAANDLIFGFAGNDTYRFDTDVALGTDTLIDTAVTGIDTLDFSATTTRNVVVSLSVLAPQSVNAGLTLNFAPGSRFEAINGGALNDTLTGNLFNNTLRGLAGNDTLDGGAGNDTLDGGGGNDTYRFDTDFALGTDTLIDSAVTGIDTLDFSATTTRNVVLNLSVLAPQIVNAGLTLSFAAGSRFEAINGGALNDSLTGNLFNNTLRGLAGNDTLDGGAGNDTLDGGAGNDTYCFDTDFALGTDTLIDTAATGTDTLDFSTTTTRNVALNLSLATAQIINPGLTLTLTSGSRFEAINGGALNDTLTGNLFANTLSGLAGNDALLGLEGNDTLIGAAGNDTLDGGGGDDTFSFDADGALGTDTLIDTAVTGIDTLDFSATTTRTIALDLRVLGPQVVNAGLTLTFAAGSRFEAINGGALNDTLTGNLFSNTLRGLAGNDSLDGGNGNDLLSGGTGNDTLIGGANADRFRFEAPLNAATNRDIITDFSVAQGDRIELENSVFTALTTTGTLSAAAFNIGAATTADHRLLYNNATGALLYDRDGNGAIAAIAFATLTPGLALTAASFSVT